TGFVNKLGWVASLGRLTLPLADGYMKKTGFNILLLLLCIGVWCNSYGNDQPKPYWQWSQLPAIPDQVGFAGSLTGISNGALLVAGRFNLGARCTPWNGNVKKWYNTIYVLEQPNGQWKEARHLPHA